MQMVRSCQVVLGLSDCRLATQAAEGPGGQEPIAAAKRSSPK